MLYDCSYLEGSLDDVFAGLSSSLTALCVYGNGMRLPGSLSLLTRLQELQSYVEDSEPEHLNASLPHLRQLTCLVSRGIVGNDWLQRMDVYNLEAGCSKADTCFAIACGSCSALGCLSSLQLPCRAGCQPRGLLPKLLTLCTPHPTGFETRLA